METRGTTDEETISYWFDLPIDVAEFEEKLGVGAESGDYCISWNIFTAGTVYGNVYIAVDMELKGRIREALIKMMLDFDIPLEIEE